MRSGIAIKLHNNNSLDSIKKMIEMAESRLKEHLVRKGYVLPSNKAIHVELEHKETSESNYMVMKMSWEYTEDDKFNGHEALWFELEDE